MEIIISKAEDSLLAHARTIRPRMRKGYCIYFGVAGQGSGLHIEDVGANLLSLANDWLTTASSMAYLCSDGDIFILCEDFPPAAMEGLFQDLRRHYGERLPHYLYRCYDLDRDYELFLALCAEKARPRVPLSSHYDEAPAPQGTARIDPELFREASRRRRERLGLQILVVDDQQFSRALVFETLGHDYELLVAKDGIQAIEAYATFAPDMVLLDIGLPHCDGHEVLRQIRELDPSAFIVMLTASNTEDDVKRALHEGAKGYVVKPFTRSKIAQYADACHTARRKVA